MLVIEYYDIRMNRSTAVLLITVGVVVMMMGMVVIDKESVMPGDESLLLG